MLGKEHQIESETPSQAVSSASLSSPNKKRRWVITNHKGNCIPPDSSDSETTHQSCNQDGVGTEEGFVHAMHSCVATNQKQTSSGEGSIRSDCISTLSYTERSQQQTGADDTSLASAASTSYTNSVLTHSYELTGLCERTNTSTAQPERMPNARNNAENMRQTVQLVHKQIKPRWPARDVKQHCMLKFLHALTKAWGLSGNGRRLCCKIALSRKVMSVNTPGPQDRGSCRFVKAMSPDGRRVLQIVPCLMDTGAEACIMGETCARRLGWTPSPNFRFSQYNLRDLRAVSGTPFVPIGIFELPVKPEGMMSVLACEFFVVADEDCQTSDCIFSDTFVQRSHLQHKIPICATRIIMAFLTILQPVSVEAGR